MTGLADREFEAPSSADEPLTEAEIEELRGGLDEDVWHVIEGKLEGRFDFDDFAGALAFVERVGALAEELWHHPTVTLSFGEVIVELWSHEVDGLHVADFVMAARIDRIYAERARAEGEAGEEGT